MGTSMLLHHALEQIAKDAEERQKKVEKPVEVPKETEEPAPKKGRRKITK